MDTDTLISKVFLRPAIWDKRLKVYTNRAVVDNCWLAVALLRGRKSGSGKLILFPSMKLNKSEAKNVPPSLCSPKPPHVNSNELIVIPANAKLRFRNRIQQVVYEFAYSPASSTFQPCSFSLSSSSASSTFNSLSSERVASPPATSEDT
jgi:hypothetical protein